MKNQLQKILYVIIFLTLPQLLFAQADYLLQNEASSPKIKIEDVQMLQGKAHPELVVLVQIASTDPAELHVHHRKKNADVFQTQMSNRHENGVFRLPLTWYSASDDFEYWIEVIGENNNVTALGSQENTFFVAGIDVASDVANLPIIEESFGVSAKRKAILPGWIGLSFGVSALAAVTAVIFYASAHLGTRSLDSERHSEHRRVNLEEKIERDRLLGHITLITAGVGALTTTGLLIYNIDAE
jgi:hypothetical protein